MTASIWEYTRGLIQLYINAFFKVVSTFNILKCKQKYGAGLNGVLFYGTEDEEKNNLVGHNNIKLIAYLLQHASKTIEICVPSLVSEIIVNNLITAHQRYKINVKIIIHNSNDYRSVQALLANGIEVKVLKPTIQLEHEFILLDAVHKFDFAVAIMGSLDYDINRTNRNRDATFLISEPIVVKTLKKEFDRIWSSSPHTAADEEFIDK